MGRVLVERNRGLVYGGGRVGLMGIVADTVLEGGGKVIGVLPSSMKDKEVAHEGLTELHIVEGMHARKAKMAAHAEAFLALPGGFGTFEELFEVITWSQLRYHCKPVGVLNVGGYFEPFVRLVENAVQEGFIPQASRDLVTVGDNAVELVEGLLARVPTERPDWVDLGEI